MPELEKTLQCLEVCPNCPNRTTVEDYENGDFGQGTMLKVSERGVSGSVEREVLEGMYKGEGVRFGTEMFTDEALDTFSNCTGPIKESLRQKVGLNAGKCAALTEIFVDAEDGWKIHENIDDLLKPEHLN